MSDHDLFPERLVCTIAETGVLLNLSTQTIRNLIARGEIRAVSIGRSRRIPRSEILRLLGGE